MSDALDAPGEGTTAGSGDRQRPLVTAVVPTYDRPGGLVRAVESVLAQRYRPLELVVVDDNPTTLASDLLARAEVDTSSLDRVAFLREGGHSGAGAARNTGVEAARGEFVAFLDDDDRWLPEKVGRQVAALVADPDVDLAYTGTWELWPDGRRRHVPREVADADMEAELACANVVGSMSVVLVRTALAREHPFDASLPAWEDLDWFLRLSRATRFVRLPEPLVEYDLTSEGRLSESFDRTGESHRRFVEKHAPRAAERGRLAARKLRGFAAYRAGRDGFDTGHYAAARRYFLAAVRAWPFEPRFWTYLLAAAGGPSTHRLARRVRSLSAPV